MCFCDKRCIRPAPDQYRPPEDFARGLSPPDRCPVTSEGVRTYAWTVRDRSILVWPGHGAWEKVGGAVTMKIVMVATIVGGDERRRAQLR